MAVSKIGYEQAIVDVARNIKGYHTILHKGSWWTISDIRLFDANNMVLFCLKSLEAGLEAEDMLLVEYDDLITRGHTFNDGPKVSYDRSEDCWVVPVDQHKVILKYDEGVHNG